MGEKSKNTQAVTNLAAEVAGGTRGKALADFRTLAEANGYQGRPGGWIYRLNGVNVRAHEAVAHGWAALAALVVVGTVRLFTVQQLAEAAERNKAEHEQLESTGFANLLTYMQSRHRVTFDDAWQLAIDHLHEQANAEEVGYVQSMHITPQGVRKIADAVDRNRAALRKALRTEVPPSQQCPGNMSYPPHRAGSVRGCSECTLDPKLVRRRHTPEAEQAELDALQYSPSERAYRAGYAHPVVVGQPCDASAFYTKVEHDGLLAAYRSRTSGARWVLCTGHARPTALTRDANVQHYPVDTEYEHGLALSMDGIRTAAAEERKVRKVRCDACSTLRRVDDLARVRVIGGAGSSETESYCKGECPRVVDVEQARAMAIVIEEQRAVADREIMSLGYDCGGCSFRSADRSRMLAHFHATGHTAPETYEAAESDPAADDDSNELLDRIVRRAQYTALSAMLGVVDGWVEGAQANHEGLGHRDKDCCSTFHPDDIKRMINDAAREVGTAEPYRG